jgi:acetylornithine/N-succinyldiaminopimelate aminotransferase
MSFDYIEQDKKHIAGTYGRYNALITSGKNATCYDDSNKEYIDFTSGIGVNSLGFADEDWVKAVAEQASKLQHISNLYYTKPNIELAALLCEKTGCDKVFFANSGAEANEGAIKIARKKSYDKYGKNRTTIISLKNSFHGRTVTTLAATGQDSFHDFFFPFTEGFVFAEANNFDDVKEKCEDTVCAIMIELIQGEGGVMPLEKEFVKQVEALCQEKDLTLIVDEVQTGIARTGKLLTSEWFDISPDVTTLAKGLGNGLPIGAILLKETVSSVLEQGQHGTTFGGNPIACSGAVQVLQKACKKDFLANVVEKGEYIKQKLLMMEEVEGVDGKGLMVGIRLKTKKSAEIAKLCVENGLLILTAKHKLRMLPPLTITYDEIDKGLNILSKILD